MKIITKIITKTILNLIITTFGVLFILSACGGGGVTVGLVNQTCSSNLFSPDCGASGQTARTKAITDCVESGECDAVPKDVQTCLTDLFSPDCDAVAETIKTRTTETIETLRETFCETNGADDNCQTTPTVMQTCTANPFDSVCGATYNTNREASCRTTPNPTACASTITRFCETEAVGTPANVFDTLCATYDTARETACRTGNHANLCDDTITRFCETEAVGSPANVFNPLCGDGKYNTPRETACRTGNHDSLCSTTITRYCETDPTLAKNFNSLCSTNTVATMARNMHCMDTDNAFTANCVNSNNAEGLMARNNHCGLGAGNGAMATAFTDMRCADDAKGVEVRNTHCGTGTDATSPAFTTECALNPAAQAILLTASECMDAGAACQPALRIICEAEVASFDTLCGDARTILCTDGAPLLTESLCNVPAYEMGRETACVGGVVTGIDTECNTLYTKYCGAGAENPFDTMAGETDTINCLNQTSFTPVRQTIVDECDGLGVDVFTPTCTQQIKESIQACLTAPYSTNCKDNRDYDNRRTARLGECQDLGTGSDAIRTAGGDNETKCRPAFDTFCVGDNLFTTTGANCFGDDDYQTARGLHHDECKKAASARVGVDCDLASAQICQSAESIYTNPFLSVCDEDGRNSLVVRQELIKRCQPLATKTPNCDMNDVFDILNECDDRPFNTNCDDYGDAGQAYFTLREQRIIDCGTGFDDRCNGTQARLCVSSDNAEAAPLAPACDNEEGIADTRSDFLAACAGDAGVRNCTTPFAMAVKTACELDPYNAMVITINAETVDCNDFDFYNGARSMRLTDCANSQSTVCDGVIGIVCSATGDSSGAGANPFHLNLCNGIDVDVLAIAQRDFCQIRANVGNPDCMSGDLSRPTTAAALASVNIGTATDVPSIPTPDTPTAEVHNEFLKGTDTGLNTNGYLKTSGAVAEVLVINMADAEYDGVRFGGDAADGIAFFAGRPAGGTARVEYYAGILAGTDLGAPLTQVSGLTMNWYGAVNWAVFDRTDSQAFAYQSGNATTTTTRDFVLKIDLGAQTFSAFFGQAAGDNTPIGQKVFILTGGYHATTGVITNGAVAFGERANANSIRTISASTANEGPYNGPLIGIIGAQGAVGVFHAQRHNGTQGISLSGGFVARAPRPDFISWTRQAANLAGDSLTIRTVADAGDSATSFIRGGTAALDVGTGGVDYTLTLADSYSLEGVDHRIVSFGGDAADGVSFAVNGDRLYSGLLSGTDLGAPLIVGSSSVNFQGRFGIIINDGTDSTYYIRHNLTLTAHIDGRFTGSVGSVGKTGVDGIFGLSGRFNQFGLLRGSMVFQRSAMPNAYHGTISGLIGVEGVIGAFKSNDQTVGAFAYAGGFVARADAVITAGTITPNARTEANWVANAVDANGVALRVYLDSSEISLGEPLARFYKGGASELDLGARIKLQEIALDFSASFTDSLGDTFHLGGGTTDGVTFSSIDASGRPQHFVGLLSTTALGHPVSHTAPSAQWAGRFGLIKKEGLNGETPYTASFILNVNFRDRQIDSSSISIPASVLANDEVADEFEFSGNYDGHGLIRGTVNYKKIVTGGGETNFAGHLSGLIGVDGAVGAFASTTTSDTDAYVGGFVAREFERLTLVSEGPVTHLRLEGYATLPTLPNQLTTSGFLKPVSGQDELDLTPANFFLRPGAEGAQTLDTNPNANQIGRRGGVGSTDDDGYHYFHTYSDGDDRGYGYGGILSTTNLGAPVADSGVAAVWTGYFSHYSNITDQDAEFYVDFTAGTVGFANAAGNGVEAKTFDGDNFTVNGQFGSPHNLTTGQLGGTVIRMDNLGTNTYNILGLIGQEGAVAVFIDFNKNTAGGFTASNPKHEDYCAANGRFCIANQDAWVKSFTTPPSAMLDPSNLRNQFLLGQRDQLNEMGTVNPQSFVMSVANSNATFDGIALGLERDDGVGFFSADIDGTRYFYAGILSDTDLGAPVGLTFEGETKGRWNGRFGYRDPVTYYEDFMLEIDFATRRIEAFVAGRDSKHFHLKGGYDANGAITDGTVDYGLFNANTRVQTAVRTPNGVLTGIIGQQGAIGAFISNATGLINGYAGAFLATPTAGFDPSVVNYKDWADIFDTPLLNQLDTTTRSPQFLGTVAGANALDETGAMEVQAARRGTLTLADAFDTITFGGDATDGVSFFWDNPPVIGYAGILADTDLGAPFTQGGGPAQVTWKGWFQALVRPVSRGFDLVINFANDANTIEAFVQQTGDNYFHLTGSFDANGVITGEVYFGTFINANKDMPTDAADPDNGFLTGLIGEQGALGAFVSGTGTRDAIEQITPLAYHNTYAGGFVASPNVVNHVRYIDWTGSFTPTLTATMLNPTDRVSQFLATATALDETGAGTINAVNKGSLTLANATFKGAGLGGQAADGVSWFWDSTNDFGYAGILAGTDLGAPLTQDSGTAKWNGSFQTTGDVTINDDLAITYSISGGRVKVNTNIKRDFLLEIDFDNDKIEAFIYHFGTRYYHLTGNFVGGVITGKVNYGTFTDLTARTATDGETIGTPRAPNGILTGLIGAYGAVGAFISGTGDKNAIATADPVYYAGGFVATPTNALDDDTVNSDNVVNYDDWLRGFITLPPDRLDISSESRRGQFLAWNSGRNDLDRTGSRRELSNDRGVLTLATTFSEIGGQAADGVSFFYDSWGSAGYAGIRSSTNLGAPLTQDSGTANWNGHIRSVGTYINREFVLEINFADSNKIEAFVQTTGEYHFHLTGSFTASGVITGKVNYGRFTAGTRTPTDNRADNGFLTGLIGMEGAVGAFVSGTGTKDAIVRLGSGNYSGGFVAHPTATSTGVNVKFNDWVRTVGPETAPNPTLRNQFLRGTADNLTATPTVPESGTVTELGSANDGTGTITPTLLTLGTTLGVSGDTKNGVGFFQGYDTAGDGYYYAGIFNGADLGAPLTSDTASGVWKGKFQVVGVNAVNKDFTLGVTFGAVTGFSELTGTVEAFVNQSGDNYYHLTGTYDRNGVITGDVDFGKFMNADKTMPETVAGERVGGTLRGLIGSNGALGVFHSTQTGSGGYAGGFVACKRNTDDTACQ